MTEGSRTETLKLSRWTASRRSLLLAAVILVSAYVLLYRRHHPDGVLAMALVGYLEGLARASGWLISLLEAAPVAVSGTRIDGRFPLRIVLDCAALDAHALHAAAVVAFPAPWRRRAAGLAIGAAVIGGANLARIVALYLAGVHAPATFHRLHEEVFQLGLVLVACLAFVGWAYRTETASPPPSPSQAVAPA